ncbi:MAG: ribosomal protein S1 [Planctomycetota bacterium]|jgi:ribosomal protein S1
MTFDSNPLDQEIASALENINLQEIPTTNVEANDGARKSGDRLYEGTIEGISGDDIIVDLGPRMQGVVSKREFDEPPSVGERHKFTLRGREDDLWILSRRDAVDLATWEELTPGSLVKARVSGQNQGGLELKIGNHSAFMPASQVDTGRVEDLSTFIGQTLTCEVLEIQRSRKRVVLSRRKVKERELDVARAEFAGNLHPGMIVTGKITRVESFGGFVDLGNGIEGLLHVSNISRKRVENPADVLTVGAEIQVQVLDIKEGGKRIGLGKKQLEPDPWDELESTLRVGSVITGKITRVADFGAFLEVMDGVDGLIHVSQLGAGERVRRVSDVAKVGEEWTVRVVSIERAEGRIGLSRLDSRGAIIGSEDSVDAGVIDEVLEKSNLQTKLGTNLGDLFKNAMNKTK